MDTDRCNRCRVDLHHSADLQLLRSVKLFSAMEVEQRIIRGWGMAIHDSNKDVFLVMMWASPSIPQTDPPRPAKETLLAITNCPSKT